VESSQAVDLQGTRCCGAHTGSGIWAGSGAQVTVNGCVLADNEGYAVESCYQKAKVEVRHTELSGNRHGTADEWAGGKVQLAT
jgi:hypothetical protein